MLHSSTVKPEDYESAHLKFETASVLHADVRLMMLVGVASV